jgi:hypothetical protein
MSQLLTKLVRRGKWQNTKKKTSGRAVVLFLLLPEQPASRTHTLSFSFSHRFTYGLAIWRQPLQL